MASRKLIASIAKFSLFYRLDGCCVTNRKRYGSCLTHQPGSSKQGRLATEACIRARRFVAAGLRNKLAQERESYRPRVDAVSFILRRRKLLPAALTELATVPDAAIEERVISVAKQIQMKPINLGHSHQNLDRRMRLAEAAFNRAAAL
jgi:hypothetical protein